MKSNRARLLGCCTAVCVLLLFSHPAGAERFADLMVGFSFSEDKTLTLTSSSESRTGEPKFDTSYTVGYRMGYWSEYDPFLGVSLGVDYTTIEDNDSLDISVLSFSPLVMIRVPLLPSSKYPRGEWLPFAAVGPGLFISKIKIPSLDVDYEDQRFDIGLDVRAGIKKMVAPAWAVNLEYRFFWFEPSYEDFIMGEAVKAEIDIYNHSIMLGVSYNF
jgi:hypothetical protein